LRSNDGLEPMMQDLSTANVVIVGGGPVGLVLALDLAWRGVPSTIIELRHAGEKPSVKCNHVSSRTMEAFRRLGLAREVRDAGLPDDYPNDIVFRTSFTGPEMGRIPIPCRRDRYTETAGPDGWWPTAEPPHRINQTFLEPILFNHAASHPLITVLNRSEAFDIEQDEDGVLLLVRNLDDDSVRAFRAVYLIGCDGGSSPTRKTIGARLHGDAVIQRVQSTHIRAPELIRNIKGQPGWFNYSYNPLRPGSVIAIDGIEEWLVHCYLLPGEIEFESVDRLAQIRTILGISEDFPFEVIANEDWIGRRLVTTHMRDRRIFIAGDAAHLWVPYAGYGMNAGIADALNLSWMMAAHLRGWAPASILDGYERERLPITDQVSRFAMRHAEQAIRERNSMPDNIEADTPEAALKRAEIGEAACALNVQQYACAGLNYGYYYDASPLILYDGETAPDYSMYDYQPSTVPGCRLPYYRLKSGESLYDLLGPEYTLLRFDAEIDVQPLLDAAEAQSIPVRLLDLEPDGPYAVMDHPLILARPDQHIGWRGRAMPDDPQRLWDVAVGRHGQSVPENVCSLIDQ